MKMKLQVKDDIIYRLMLSLKRDNNFITANDIDNDYLFHINKGWIESLEWVLGLSTKEEKDENKIKYYLHEIVAAVDIAVGDDGLRSKEVIEILEEENNERLD